MTRSGSSGGSAVSASRRSALASIHIGVKALGLDDGDYRDLLERVVGVRSASQCTDAQLGRIMDEFRRLGFARGGRAASRRATHPVARKARALWISLYQLGAIENASERALEAFAKRQLGIDRLAWADQSHSDALIEALKAIGERHGWRQAGVRDDAAANQVKLKAALVRAIAGKLAALGDAGAVAEVAGCDAWSTADLQMAAHELGRRLRAHPARHRSA